LNQVKVIADTAAINLDPMDAFNPATHRSVLFQGGATDLQTSRCLLSANKLNHWFLLILRKSGAIK
jgi:hypothetical protein